MATPSTTWIKSDEIHVDTSHAPWMDTAKAELGKNISEVASNDEFIRSLRMALAVQTLENQIQSFGKDSRLLGDQTGAARYRVLTKELRPPKVNQMVGQMDADRLQERNPEIKKYFTGVKTDPIYDKKGRSFDIASTYESSGYGNITAWCAAFVNWCLSRAGAPHLGYATAKSWLDFGTPVAHPVYGCITVIKPSSSTGSTTGHVAFFVELQGNKVKLLGGNQGDRVSESGFKVSNVLGYRWPTTINHYQLATTGILT
jgi:uncharacterized protein (TIGR02594 family)